MLVSILMNDSGLWDNDGTNWYIVFDQYIQMLSINQTKSKSPHGKPIPIIDKPKSIYNFYSPVFVLLFISIYLSP